MKPRASASQRIRPLIVDLHGEFLSDTLAKLRGYVAYLREYPDVFKQVLFVGDMGGDVYKVLNLLRVDVQDAVMGYSDVDCKALFYSSYANDHQEESGWSPVLIRARFRAA